MKLGQLIGPGDEGVLEDLRGGESTVGVDVEHAPDEILRRREMTFR